jgi:hypothetical protein
MTREPMKAWEIALLALAAAAIAFVIAPSPDLRIIHVEMPSDVLGFWGNILGGAIGGVMTLIAGYFAWRAVKLQVDEQTRIAERQRSDVADRRLAAAQNTIGLCFGALRKVRTAAAANRDDGLREFDQITRGPAAVSLYSEYFLLGQDYEAIGRLFKAFRSEALSWQTNAAQVDVTAAGHINVAAREFIRAIIQRRRWLRHGKVVDDLLDAKFIDFTTWDRNGLVK